MIEVEFNDEIIPFYEITDSTELEKLIKPYKHQWLWNSMGNTDMAYFNVPCSFDIETTTYNLGTEDEPQYTAFMYIWQFAFDDIAICGRTWTEFVKLLNLLKKWLDLKDYKRLPIYSHFAAFEFQHMRNFITVERVFARKEYFVVQADFNSAFQLRCSWALSNMGLGKAISTVPNAKYNKQDGDDFDYTKVRLPNTELSNLEYTYCLCDVLGLNEYLRYMMNEDTMCSIPMTSTGYVRRDCRKHVLANKKNKQQVSDLALSDRLYVYAKTARRGGNCHASAYYTAVELENVPSFDRKSSYPAEMVTGEYYPVSAFRQRRANEENLLESIQEYACLIDITFYNFRLKAPTPIPYVPVAKCTRIKGLKLRDNGRVVDCECCSMVITDLDYKIIDSQYKCDSFEVSALYVATRGHLNDEFRLVVRDWFKQKCKLESGDQYLYNKFKNKINALFGMMLTDICSPEIIYKINGNEKPWKKQEIDINELLGKYYNSSRSFLSYQHGVWVVAGARYQHQLGIDCVGMDCVYGDTDSVKYVGEHDEDFKKVNDIWLEKCYANDISPIVQVNGKTYTLGLWEKEKTADKFVTLGAKKYACQYGDKIKITVAGLNKEKGAKWLSENGGLDAFKIDNTVPPEFSGRTASHYINVDKPYHITIDGCDILTGSAIAVEPATYTFGVTEDYLQYYTSVQ